MPRQLTAKQEAFAAAVAKGSSMAEAYRTAYAVGSMSEDSIRAEGGKLAKNPRIALRIEQLRAPAIAKVEAEVAKTIDVNLTTWLFENARIGYSDIRQVLTPGGELLPPEEWPEDAAKTVKTYRVKTKTFTDKDGNTTDEKTVEVQLWDKGAALDRIGRHLGAYEADNAQRSPLEAAIAQLPKDKAQQLIEFVRSEKAKRAA